MLKNLVWSLGCWVLLAGLALLAGGKSDSDACSSEVAAALVKESSGNGLDRRTLLQRVRDDHHDSAAWWQSGYVKLSTGWQSWEASGLPDLALLGEYRQRRDKTGSGAASQLKLADWCRDVGMPDQERAHLIQALRTGQAAHPEGILRRLGYRRVGSTWLTEAELATASAELASIAKQSKRLRPRLEKLAEQLEGKPAVREKALSELQSLANGETVWLFEQALAGRSEGLALVLVNMLSQVESYRASQALARLAAFSSWDAVRAAAIGKLKTRPWEDLVPGLLEYLQEPVKFAGSSVTIHSTDSGIQGLREWRFLWTREGRHSIDVACSHLLYFRYVPAGPLLSHGETPFEQSIFIWKDQVAAADFAYLSQSRVETANDQIDEKNRSVAAVLSAVTELPATMPPFQWWEWWDGTINQLSDSEPKPFVIITEEVQTLGVPEIEIQRIDPLTGRKASCLVAGTPVWTEEGFRPIEEIRIGDRVLSKSIETGELKYQPVLHTTHRKDATAATLAIGEETIEASLGHNFWISGRGWTRVNQLQGQMPAHTPTGTAAVAVGEQTRTADVYNLVVADFHTYFVGKSMLLGHDVIIPAPTDIRVPGLDPNLTAAK